MSTLHRGIRGRLPSLFLILSACGSALVSLPRAGDAQQPILIPQDLEFELALSALPPHLRAEATVYRYIPGIGMEVEREGNNGFHAMVSRVEPAIFKGDWAYEKHPTDVLLPIAFDQAGVDGPMQPFLDASELLARGSSPEELKRIMRARFEAGAYPPAARAGVAFMLAPLMRAYPDPVGRDLVLTINLPHRMFYAPFVSPKDVGADRAAPLQPYVIQEGVHGYIGQRAGPEEASAILKESSELLAGFCSLHSDWCLPK